MNTPAYFAFSSSDSPKTPMVFSQDANGKVTAPELEVKMNIQGTKKALDNLHIPLTVKRSGCLVNNVSLCTPMFQSNVSDTGKPTIPIRIEEDDVGNAIRWYTGAYVPHQIVNYLKENIDEVLALKTFAELTCTKKLIAKSYNNDRIKNVLMECFDDALINNSLGWTKAPPKDGVESPFPSTMWAGFIASAIDVKNADKVKDLPRAHGGCGPRDNRSSGADYALFTSIYLYGQHTRSGPSSWKKLSSQEATALLLDLKNYKIKLDIKLHRITLGSDGTNYRLSFKWTIDKVRAVYSGSDNFIERDDDQEFESSMVVPSFNAVENSLVVGPLSGEAPPYQGSGVASKDDLDSLADDVVESEME